MERHTGNMGRWIISLWMIVILGVYGQAQYHHHDCGGRVCLVLPGHATDHDQDRHSPEGHRHIHPCPDGHEYVAAQPSDSGPLPAVAEMLAEILPEIPYGHLTVAETDQGRECPAEAPPFVTPTGRKAPPVR